MPDLGKTTCGPFQNREWRQAYSAGGGGLSPTEMYAREMEFRENLVKYNITCRGTQGGIVPTDGELWEILRCHDEELAWGWDDYRNTFIGLDAAYTYSHLQNDYGIIEGGSAYDNVVVGYRAGYGVSSDCDNVIIGSYSGYSGPHEYSVVIGYNAGYYGETYCDIIIGGSAGYYYDSGAEGGNIIIGCDAGYYFGNQGTEPSANVIIGDNTCHGNLIDFWGSTTSKNSCDTSVIIGEEAAWGIQYPSHDIVAIGTNACLYSWIIDHSAIIGPWAGEGLVYGDDNVIIGGTACANWSSYSGAVIIGDEIDNVGLISTCTLTLQPGAGLGIGDYHYITTCVVDGVESIPSLDDNEFTVTTTSGNQQVLVGIDLYPRISNLAGYTCTARKIYRTAANGDDFYLLATINDNTTTSYLDSISDATLKGAGHVHYYGAGPILALGAYTTIECSNQIVIGDSGTYAYYNDMFLNGIRSPTPYDITINACGGQGTDVAAADLILAGGRSTGNATPGNILFKVGTVGASGTALQTLATVATISGTGITVGTDPVVAVPTPALGDIIYGNATPAWAKLAGNTTTTRKWLTQTGTGAVSAAPSWEVAPGAVWSNIASNPQAGEYRIKYLRLDSSLHMVVVYDGTPEVAPASYPTIISNPGSGEYRIKALRLDSGLNIVVVYDGTPEP